MTKTKAKKYTCVGEEVKIAATLTLQKFRATGEQKELEFPSSLTSQERAFIHSLARNQGLKSKSRGKGANRFLTVYKKDGSTIVQADAVFQLVRASRQHVISLLQRFPVTNKERQDLVPLSERDRLLIDEARDVNRSTGRLNNGIPQIPPPRANSEYSSFRETLPIWPMRDEIVSIIEQHQVILVAGETGSGKTTQIPQYILDSSCLKHKPCRIICAQPRRIAALNVAERVALERDEKVGQTVGYQIRLESRVSPKTLLTFCTSGVLLRTLMGSDAALATVTHIVVDEIHERDRFTDFLLIILRDALAKFRNLKLVLMSAALDLQLFLKYFNGCLVINVPGRCFEVQELFLEDVLKCTGYTSKAMQQYQNGLDQKQKQKKKLTDWCSKVLENSGADLTKENNERNDESSSALAQAEVSTKQSYSSILEAGVSLISEMEKCISEAWINGGASEMIQMLHLIVNENISVDYQHSETGVAPLMVAAGRGCTTTVEQLLNLGANVDVRASNDWTALDWARNFNRNDIVEIIEAHITACESSYSDMSDLLNKTEGLDIGSEDKLLLDIYHHSFDDEKVDINLILCLLHKILTCQEEGAILVFLPGYDEIVTLRDRIMLEDKRFADSSRFMLCMLHSSMHSFDQKRVFRPAPSGVRKIILSTNIAETSVTFNDVVFVIDSGKVKEKSFDALASVSSLKPVWISKSSSLQRKGRAGRCRPGVCYHLFSRIRFKSMQEFQQPEILRVPLQDLCLHTKLLAPPNTPIADFLARAPDPPAFMVTRNAVQLLKTIDALDPWEGLTELGHHLLDLPVDPRLGKMVLYAVILKCLDPILTISCALAYKDPFVIPFQAHDKMAASMNRKKLASGTFSDHMTLLRAFQAWQKACSDGWEKAFCEKNYLSSSTMEMIVGMRAQLLGQLRASGFVRARGGGDIRDLNSNSENWSVVKAALVAGMYPNLIRVDRDRMQLITQKESKVRFHPSSILAEKPHSARTTAAQAHTQVVEELQSDWLIYEEMTRSEHLAYARCCTLVSPITVALFAGPSRLPLDAVSEPDGGMHGDDCQGSNSDSEFDEKGEGQKAMLKLDDWISFRVDSEAAHLTLQLRQKWHSLFFRRIRAPAKPWSQVDEAVVRTIISVISSEEQVLGLQQPPGIGQRPRPMSTDYLSSTPTVGLRCSSVDTENSDDSSSVGMEPAHYAPRPQRKIILASPQKKDRGALKSSDERSDSSSVRSTSSACGSSPISPCHSPALSGSSSEKETSSGTPSGRNASGQRTKYFVIKASSQKVIDASLSKGVWVFSTSTERKLQKCLQDGKAVQLIFSVQGSGHFQGFARLTPEIFHEKIPEFPMPNSGNTYKIEWIKRANIPFQSTRHLQNPWNENRKVQISRDGQELEPSIGESLCKLWDKVPPFVCKTPYFSQPRVNDEAAMGIDAPKGNISDTGSSTSFVGYRQQHQFAGRPIRGTAQQSLAGMHYQNVGRQGGSMTSGSSSWPHKMLNHSQSK